MPTHSADLRLPDTSKWQPKKHSSESLESALLTRCRGIETLINLRVQLEKEMNQYNFDSGPGVEEIIRAEFSRLLPNRYSVRAGHVVDQKRTAGDCDLVIFNDFWFPEVKAGATAESRKVFFPIDGVYAVAEIKQTLDFKILDDAMEKLIKVHRLDRPQTDMLRLTENQDSPEPCPHGIHNPLYSMIIATDVKEGISTDKIVERFVKINKQVERLEVVRSLCILGSETVTWGFQYENVVGPTLFNYRDLYRPIFPVRHSATVMGSALYVLLADLLINLNQSILAAEDVAYRYGLASYNAKAAISPEMTLAPDKKWLELKEQPCGRMHNFDI